MQKEVLYLLQTGGPVKAVYHLCVPLIDCSRSDYLGAPTLNVATVRAGLNVNSVSDLAEIGIDIRSIPGLDHSRIQEHLIITAPISVIRSPDALPPVVVSKIFPNSSRASTIPEGSTRPSAISVLYSLRINTSGRWSIERPDSVHP
jgi:hypothetical protein